MIDPRKQFTPSENEQNISNWEQTLQELREKRKHQVEPNTQQNPAPQTAKSAAPIIRPKPQGRENLETNKEVLEQYLEQWQVAHNISTDENKAQNPYGDTDNDTNVVLVEEWIEAQHSLQGEVSLDGVQKVDTVWYNPKHQVMTEEHSSEQATENQTLVIRSAESVPVSINVLEPKLINGNQPVVCLSEKELIERLNNRLLPHLTKSVNGMVRVAVQRHTASLTFKLQKNLTEEVPDLVSDILNYNLKSVLAEIKRDLKFKR